MMTTNEGKQRRTKWADGERERIYTTHDANATRDHVDDRYNEGKAVFAHAGVGLIHASKIEHLDFQRRSELLE